MGSCCIAAWPAGAGSGRSPACSLAGRAPGQHRAGCGAEETPVATLKLNVDLVNVFFTVKDKAGNLIPRLTQGDCVVSEDNQPQTLKSFVAETQQPLTLGFCWTPRPARPVFCPWSRMRAASSWSAYFSPKMRHFCSPSM